MSAGAGMASGLAEEVRGHGWGCAPSRAACGGAALLVSVWSLAGCTRPSEAQRDFLARDSAGVEVLEVAGRSGAAWRLASSPDVEIGQGEGDDLYRVRGAALLSDGRIAVANAGSAELRIYSHAGKRLASAGRFGRGPGEFVLLTGMSVLPGDTLLAFDSQTAQLAFFDGAGSLVRSVPVRPPPRFMPFLFPVGWLAPGRFLVRATVDGNAEGSAIADGAHHTVRQPVSLLAFGLDGGIRDDLGSFAGDEASVRVGQAGGGRLSIQSVPMPFTRRLRVAAAGSTVAVGETDRYEFRLYRPDGTLRRIVRRTRRPEPVTDADLEGWIAHRFPDADAAERRRIRQEYRSADLPDFLPAFEAMLLDRRGRLWIREFGRGDRDDRTTRWSIVDPEHRKVAQLEMPAALEPYEIGDDYVLGVWTDELGVERVRLYRLITSSGA